MTIYLMRSTVSAADSREQLGDSVHSANGPDNVGTVNSADSVDEDSINIADSL